MWEKQPHFGGIFDSDSMEAKTLHHLFMTCWGVSSFFCFPLIFWRGEVSAFEPSPGPGFGEQT